MHYQRPFSVMRAPQVVHEDWQNGVLGFERRSEIPAQRLLVVINSGGYQADDASYSLSVHGGSWTVRSFSLLIFIATHGRFLICSPLFS
jgi:hypothetical protein